MVTMEQIKKELANIRYYYSRKDTFAKAFDSVGQNGMLKGTDVAVPEFG